MSRPTFITNEDIARYEAILEKDDLVPQSFKEAAILKEVLFSGFWLKDQLDALKCEEHIIVQMQFTLGARSFGSAKSSWEIAEELLKSYQDGTLEFIDQAALEKEIEETINTDVPRDPKSQN